MLTVYWLPSLKLLSAKYTPFNSECNPLVYWLIDTWGCAHCNSVCGIVSEWHNKLIVTLLSKPLSNFVMTELPVRSVLTEIRWQKQCLFSVSGVFARLILTLFQNFKSNQPSCQLQMTYLLTNNLIITQKDSFQTVSFICMNNVISCKQRYFRL
jgi:hypothetical protein